MPSLQPDHRQQRLIQVGGCHFNLWFSSTASHPAPWTLDNLNLPTILHVIAHFSLFCFFSLCFFFIVADVSQPLLGAVFLRTRSLWWSRRCDCVSAVRWLLHRSPRTPRHTSGSPTAGASTEPVGLHPDPRPGCPRLTCRSRPRPFYSSF